jgi:hypothetical protein
MDIRDFLVDLLGRPDVSVIPWTPLPEPVDPSAVPLFMPHSSEEVRAVLADPPQCLPRYGFFDGLEDVDEPDRGLPTR